MSKLRRLKEKSKNKNLNIEQEIIEEQEEFEKTLEEYINDFQNKESEREKEFEEWLNSYIDKSTKEKLSELEKQILKMIYEYDKQIEMIEKQLKLIDIQVPPQKGFIGRVYEMKINLINERNKAIDGKISALEKLAKINLDIAKHLEKENNENIESINDLLE